CTSFLSEGTGIAIVGCLLSLQLFNRNLVLEFINYSYIVYSNILVALSILIILCCIFLIFVFNCFVKQFELLYYILFLKYACLTCCHSCFELAKTGLSLTVHTY